MTITMPYGSWRSPITAKKVSAAAVRFSEPCFSEAGIFWLEKRPQEDGRQTIMQKRPDGALLERLTAPYSALTRVHEYGGGCYLVVDADIYFVNLSDQRLYRLRNDQITPVTPDNKKLRFADFSFDAKRNRLYSVCEDHSQPDAVSNRLVAIALTGQNAHVTTLASGQDFYACPRLHSNGSQLAWLSWRHPHMPWDQTELWLADLDEAGEVQNTRLVAGAQTESLYQPEWSESGHLHVISDRSGWWNLYRQQAESWQPLMPYEGDFGLPHWQFGVRTYGFLEDGTVLASCHTRSELWRIGADQADKIEHDFSSISYLRTAGNRVLFIAGYPDKSTELIEMDCKTLSFQSLRKIDAEDNHLSRYFSRAEPISFSTGGKDMPLTHGYFYKPVNPDYSAPEKTKPPLIVISHGGPTAATSAELNLKIQFWTSRGFAVVDVNYRGSSGYGRAYRNLLKGQWGLVDVEDCIAAARYLVERGDANPDQLCIRGSSAGGYTTLAALTFHDLFKAGASYYGIGDMAALARHTHKFEAHYLDSLIGPYPQEEAIYHARSPIHHADKLACPVIFFQGLKDKVVPPAQAEAMVAALDAKKIPVAYLSFEDEGHGFVCATNIEQALNSELAFYARVLGFTLDDDSVALLIRHLGLVS